MKIMQNGQASTKGRNTISVMRDARKRLKRRRIGSLNKFFHMISQQHQFFLAFRNVFARAFFPMIGKSFHTASTSNNFIQKKEY
jgi:hypothetical protein